MCSDGKRVLIPVSDYGSVYAIYSYESEVLMGVFLVDGTNELKDGVNINEMRK